MDNLNQHNINTFTKDPVNDFYQTDKEIMEQAKNEEKEELLRRWKKAYSNAPVFPANVAAMHPAVVNFLLSINTVDIYDNIAQQNGLDENGRNILPAVIWQLAQSRNWADMENLLRAKMPSNSNLPVIARRLEEEFIAKIKVLVEKPIVAKKVTADQSQSKIIQLSLAKALEQYPKLGEQVITFEPLKIRMQAAPVKGSIRNWIADYHDNLGAGKHSPIDRGNYLFHSENGKRLPANERQKLSTILKSLDEAQLLSIDEMTQNVVFVTAENVASNKTDFNQLAKKAPETSTEGPRTAVPTSQIFSNRTEQISKDKDVFEKFAPKGIEQDSLKRGFSPNLTNVTTLKVERSTNNLQNENNVKNEVLNKIEQAGVADNYFHTFTKFENKEKSNNVHFSTPQKMPVEKVVEMPTANSTQSSNPSPIKDAPAVPRASIHRNPYHIVPSRYVPEENFEDSKGIDPKLKGNVVNLKDK